jgi:Spy/CpxP family protein refolding chaperone
MKRTVALAVITLSFAVLGAFAQPGPGGPGGPGGPRHQEMLVQSLNLSTEQKASWDAIESATRAAVQPLMEQRRTLHDQIETALDAATPDVAAIGTLMVQSHAVDKQLKAAHEASHSKLSALLTAEQRMQFDRFAAPPPPMR